MTEVHITKIELLKETGISYGQLYRWKRAELIPEDWFIKRSSYTGQETVFPKDAVLERISLIQELKSKMTHEQIADMLAGRQHDVDLTSLNDIPGINAEIKAMVTEEDLDFNTATVAIAVSQIIESNGSEADAFVDTLGRWMEKGLPTDYPYMDIVLGDDDIHINFKKVNTEIIYDGDYSEYITKDLDSIRQSLNIKMNKKGQV